MQRTNSSHRSIIIKRKQTLAKSEDQSKRIGAVIHRVKDMHLKIPQIINELQKNIKLLRKYYHEVPCCLNSNQSLSETKKTLRPRSSSSKKKNKVEEAPEQQITVAAEIDDLKKSFLTVNGYQTNNIVELYNFYKKNLEKSTRLFGSTSMSNMINLTHNHSEIRDKGIIRPSTSYVIAIQQSCKEEPESKKDVKLPVIMSENVARKANEMVNVASLLADKKKISRKNICENMNSQNLFNQAKKKLYRPNPNDNIEKFYKLKENLRQGLRISPEKKKPSTEVIKERSSSKKLNRKLLNPNDKAGNQVEAGSRSPVTNIDTVEGNTKETMIKSTEVDRSKSIQPVQNSMKVCDKVEVKEECEKDEKDGKEGKEGKELKSAKSSRSVKSIKSPNSIKSPSLNQAVLLDVTISGDASERRKMGPSYFVPRVHSNLHDSLLDCQITPKDQSRIVDLESIPFDF